MVSVIVAGDSILRLVEPPFRNGRTLETARQVAAGATNTNHTTEIDYGDISAETSVTRRNAP
ncbi:hypothetical protein Halar_1056 [halophilic archaeon DL31]|nr:hypothetical protein Halar_1056 [halophilic archaeon DL31]